MNRIVRHAITVAAAAAVTLAATPARADHEEREHGRDCDRQVNAPAAYAPAPAVYVPVQALAPVRLPLSATVPPSAHPANEIAL